MTLWKGKLAKFTVSEISGTLLESYNAAAPTKQKFENRNGKVKLQ